VAVAAEECGIEIYSAEREICRENRLVQGNRIIVLTDVREWAEKRELTGENPDPAKRTGSCWHELMWILLFRQSDLGKRIHYDPLYGNTYCGKLPLNRLIRQGERLHAVHAIGK